MPARDVTDRPNESPNRNRPLSWLRQCSRSLSIPGGRTALRIGTTVALLLVGTLVAIHTLDTGKLLQSLRTADPQIVALAGGVYLLSWPLRGRRFDDILDAMGARCGTLYATGVIFLSQSANLVVPARAGDGLRLYLLDTHREISYPTGAASLTVERLFDLVVLLGLSGVALGWFLATGQDVLPGTTSEYVVPAILVGLVAVSAALALVFFVRWGVGYPSFLGRWRDHPWVQSVVRIVTQFGQGFRELATNPRAIATVTAGSLSIWVLDVVTAVVVLHAVRETIGMASIGLVAVVMLAVSVGNLAKVLPLTQGGIGLYEGAFTAILVGFSPIGSGVALAVAILDHALKNVLTLVGGSGVALALGLSPAGNADREDESAEF